MSVPNTFASATSAIPLANLDADFAYYDAAFQIVGTAMEVNYTFRLEDPTDNTKKAEFVMSGITTGTTRQYTLPNATGTLATLANTSQTFTGSTVFAPSTNSGTVTIGGIPQTGTITLGRSTASQTVDIAVGATTAASTKTVNIGTTGVSTSTTNINYGSAVTGALVTHIWNAGANNMRFDSAGNLGIGTTAPSSRLHVQAATPVLTIQDTTSAAGGVGGTLNFIGYTSGTAGANVEAQIKGVKSSANAAGELQFYTSDSAGTSQQRAIIDGSGNLGIGTTSPGGNSVNRVVKAYGSTSSSVQAQSSATTISLGAGGGEGYVEVTGAYPLEFIVNGSERARLDASGALLIGATSLTGASNSNSVQIGAGLNTGTVWVNHINGTGSTSRYVNFAYAGTEIGSITQSGTTAVLYNTSSDYRLKNITGPITTSGAYIDSLKPVEGTWKADGSTFVGLIAHETQEVSRTTIATGTKDGDEMQGMDYSSAEIIANLIAEIQDLRKRVSALEPTGFVQSLLP